MTNPPRSRSRPARPAAIALALCVVLAVIGAQVYVHRDWFDPDSHKQAIVDAVFRATGRQLTLAGPLRLTLGLHPVVEAQDAAFANRPGGTRPQMMTVGRLQAQVNLLALLSREIEVTQVTLIRPDILLETDAQGRGNWQFDRPAAPPGPPSASNGGSRLTPVLDRLDVQDARLTWHNGVTGRTATADIPAATLDLSAGPAHLSGTAQASGAAVQLDATLGTWPQLSGAAPGPWPVKLAVTVGDATLALDGTADPAARSFTGRLDAAIPDLARLGTLLQQPDLPALHDLRLAATIPSTMASSGGLPQDITLQAGPSDLGSLRPGLALNHLALTWPAGQPARLDADGTMPGGPWRASMGLSPAGQAVSARAITITSPAGDLAGDIAVSRTPRPSVRGTLVSNRVDLDAIRALVQPPAAPAPAPQAAAPASSGTANPAPPADPALPWDLLRRADADLQMRAGLLRVGGADYRNATVHAVLQDGALTVDPASVQAPEGRIDLSASADARPPSPPVVLNLRAAAFALDPLIQALGLPGGSDAVMELDVALHGAGVTAHAIAASLTGHAGLAIVDGDVSNALLGTVMADVLHATGLRLDPAGRTHIRCLALRADAANGQVTLPALKLDSTRLSLEGGGTINLAEKTLALHLRPLVRLGGAGVAAPMRLEGPWRHPAVALDPTAPDGRVGVTLGGVTGPPDRCAAELTAARDGHPGPLPADAPPGKAPKPADLLRSFLK